MITDKALRRLDIATKAPGSTRTTVQKADLTALLLAYHARVASEAATLGSVEGLRNAFVGLRPQAS